MLHFCCYPDCLLYYARNSAARAVQFIANRSLWIDECFIALNLRSRDLFALIRPLDYDQAAPIGFLMVEKFAVSVLGDSEHMLRLFPLLAGILSIFLFLNLAKRYVSGIEINIALILFSISTPLIYYSSEAKQYSSDVLITLSLLIFGYRFIESNDGSRWMRALILAFAGAIAIWAAYPSIFVMPGILIAAIITSRNKQRPIFREIVGISFVWAASFLASYFISLRHITTNTHLHSVWEGSFAPIPPGSLGDIRWIINALLQVTEYPGGFALYGLGSFLLILGLMVLYRNHKPGFIMMFSPFIAALAASAVHKYPFADRLLLFLVPIMLLCISLGVVWIIKIPSISSKIPGFLALLILIYHPIVTAGDYLREPMKKEEMKPLFERIAEEWESGDFLLITHDAQWAFRYYARDYGLDELEFEVSDHIAEDNRSEEDLYLLPSDSDRVWIVFSHLISPEARQKSEILLTRLRGIGDELYQQKEPGTELYLFSIDRESRDMHKKA